MSETKRRRALAALLQAYRSERGLSVESAAISVGIGHMTWRRAEQGYASRTRTHGVIDKLFGLPPGTVRAALSSDERMSALAQQRGVNTQDLDTPVRADRFVAGALPHQVATGLIEQLVTLPSDPAIDNAINAVSAAIPAMLRGSR